MTAPSGRTCLFDTPAEYRIRVFGRLDDRWRNRLDGFAVDTLERGGEAVRTEIRGRFGDQAAPMGMLSDLYARGIPLVLVERIRREREIES